MNRLTKRYKSGIVTLDADAFMETQETVDREIQNFYPAKKAVERLAEYEDAEEIGLILRLPCKVGDKVYVAYPETRSLCDIHPCTVQSIYLTDDNNSKARSHLNIKSHISMFTKRINLDQIGKTVFLTR